MGDGHRGRCRCGSVQFTTEGPPRWVAHCHCADCRRSTGAPFSTYVGYASARVTLTGAPTRFASSPGVHRSFCARCGTPIAYEGDRWPDEIHLFAGTFEAPESLQPQVHVYVRDALPWISTEDGLPRRESTS